MDPWRHPYRLTDCKESSDIANRFSAEAKHSSDGSVPYRLIEKAFLVLYSAKVLQAEGLRIRPQKS